MSVLISDLPVYCAADMPEADGATAGGAINFNARAEFEGSIISPSTLFDAVSSSTSDTATKLSYSGRDSTGVVQTETLTLNGQSKVNGTKSLERLLAGVTTGGAIGALANPGGTAAVGDLALISHTLVISAHTMQAGSANATSQLPAVAKLQSGDGANVSPGQVLHTTGGTGPNQIRRILSVNPYGLGADFVAVDRNWSTVPDSTTTYEIGHGFVFSIGASNGGALLGTSTQTLAITRLFSTVSADVSGGSVRTYYEEVFFNNNNQSSALTNAQIIIQSETPSLPSGIAVNIALANALNDTNTIANRQTAPSSVTSFTSGAPPQSISVPSPGNLPASGGAASATGAQKVVLQMVIQPGTAAYEAVFDLRVAGNSN